MDGFNTFEKQDKVLLGLNSGSDAAAAMRILRQQGFAVQTFTAEHEVTPAGLLQLLADKAAELDCAFIATGTMPASRWTARGVLTCCLLRTRDRPECRAGRSAAGSAG